MSWVRAVFASHPPRDGLGRTRQVDLHPNIAHRDALTRQDVPRLDLRVGEEVGGFGKLLDLPLDEPTLARAAAAHAATVGEVHPAPEGGVEEGLAPVDHDGQGVDAGGVAGLRRRGFHTRSGGCVGLRSVCPRARRGEVIS
jgi:hypothetical protein